MCEVIFWRNELEHLLGTSNVLSQFAQQYVDVDMCGKFGNNIIRVIIPFLFVSHLRLWQS